MKRQENLLPFTPKEFCVQVRKASQNTGIEDTTQALYLATYLQQRKPNPATMVIESPYVDRHYVHEFVGYYSAQLEPPPNQTTRIHFFAAKYSENDWVNLLHRAIDTPEDVKRELECQYLGYVVVRPVASCPIGRTLVRPYDDPCDPASLSRHYEPAGMRQEVHISGMTLSIRALPFQQQDQGLGACATTALWILLARVLRIDGGRAVTPLEVTAAALGLQQNGPALPASDGLNIDAKKRAIRAFGCISRELRVGAQPSLFLIYLKTYLRSGIPVILRFYVDGVLHAAAAVGYRESDDIEQTDDLVTKLPGSGMRLRGITRLYLHDDRLGPYARMKLRTLECTSEEVEIDGTPQLRIRFDTGRRAEFEGFKGELTVLDAITAVYSKMRLSAEDLVEAAEAYFRIVLQVTPTEKKAQLRVEPYFERSGDYLAHLPKILSDAARCVQIRRYAHLSRYVGVIRFFTDETWVCDWVLDTTDIGRDQLHSPRVLLIIPAVIKPWERIAEQLQHDFRAELL